MAFQKIFVYGLFCLVGALGAGCQASSKNSANSHGPPANFASKTDDFGERLKAVQDAKFDYIYAFRRFDGGEFDKDDKHFVKQNAPANTNQWILTDDGKVVIAGSNYRFSAENMESLKSRFRIEDYSPGSADPTANANAGNSNSAVDTDTGGMKNIRP